MKINVGINRKDPRTRKIKHRNFQLECGHLRRWNIIHQHVKLRIYLRHPGWNLTGWAPANPRTLLR